MVKWDTSTIVAWTAAVVSTGKLAFDFIAGKKDREQKTATTEHQIESTERMDLSKLLKDSLDSLRQDVIRLEEKSNKNEVAWIDEAKQRLTIQKELNDAHNEIEQLKKTSKYYEELIEQYQRENIELKAEVVELTHRVAVFQTDNYTLQKNLMSLQHQVNQNSEAILIDVMPVGAPEVIMNSIVSGTDKFEDKGLKDETNN